MTINRHFKLSIISILTLLFACLPVLSETPKETIAVIDFEGQNVSAMDAAVVSGFLRTSLVNIGVYNLVDRKNMEQVLAEQGFQMTGCTTEECAVKMGKLLNVQKMVIGSLSQLMGVYYVTANIVDVETGQIVVSKRVKSQTGSDLAEAVDNLAQKLVYEKDNKDIILPPIQKQPQIQPAPALVPAEAPAAAAPVTYTKPDGFFDIFVGASNGTMDLTFKNIVYKVHEDGLYMDYHYEEGWPEAYSEVSFENLETEGASMPWGIRIGMFQKAFGMDLEISHYSLQTIDQQTEATYDGTRTVDFKFSTADPYLKVDSYALAVDLLLAPGSVVRPYAGAGIGITLNKIYSDYIKQWYDPDTAAAQYRTPLDETSAGFLLRVPVGIRFMLGKSAGFFAEYRISYNNISFDRNIDSEKDNITLKGKQILFGLSIGL
ncbi:MAG: hypothetical protein JXJ19_00740 [Elusimicrobia bacterium]|nr:hypothetical protein [Elusimicrobiota bacterium]